MRARLAAVAVFAALLSGACSGSAPTPTSAGAAKSGDPKEAGGERAMPEELRGMMDQTFVGDLEALKSRRLIRAGVPFNRSFFFIDNGTPRGLSYEYLMAFEQELNKKIKAPHLKVHVVPLPMPRDSLIPALQAGKIDLIVAQLTVTPARQLLVDFTKPTRDNVNEVVVTGPGAPAIATLDDLSGREVFVRRSSSYFESLIEQNKKLAAAGKAPVVIRSASESLEDDDLLEMVNAGLIPATVVDDYLASFWKQVFSELVINTTTPLRTGGALGVALRKNSPQLAGALNEFIAKQGLDSTFGAILNRRYLQNTKYVKNATSDEERKKFTALVELFRRYGDKYKFDYLLMAAQGYQESRLDQGAKSPVGAVGVMQLMPETGKEQKVGDIRKIEPNVHAGVKYMRFIRDSFFENEPMDDLNKGLFTFAAYNAGPGRIRQLRKEAETRGLDPNVWFGQVERIASERIGRETVTYVSNIYKYYVAYKLVTAEQQRKKAAAGSTGSY
jgi:membrane-bound lytic murein transglycosylase MltF